MKAGWTVALMVVELAVSMVVTKVAWKAVSRVDY